MFSIFQNSDQWFLRVGWFVRPVKSKQHAVDLVNVFGLSAAHSNTIEVN